jgi:RimJ/RimL family protein N-acetyltransferase
MPTLPDLEIRVDDSITLTPLRPGDAPALHRAVHDPELRRRFPLPEPYSLELARTWCTTTTRELRVTGRALVLAVRHNGEFAGSIDAKRIDWWALTTELSYWTAAHARGRSIMPRVVATLSRWLLRELHFERIELRIAPDNPSSIRVAEKAGYAAEGTARNAGFTNSGRSDLVIYSLIPSDLSQQPLP